MDYADDICMRRFTPNQINRMRCTIEHYRSDLALTGPTPCNNADLTEPLGVLDLTDLSAFIDAFSAQQAAADLASPAGVFDLADVQAFVASFNAGCP